MPITIRNIDAPGAPAQLTPPATTVPQASGCCGGEAPAGADACCARDAEVKSSAGSGCGCGTSTDTPAAPAPKGCCGRHETPSQRVQFGTVTELVGDYSGSMRFIFTTLAAFVILSGSTGIASQQTTRDVSDEVEQSQKAAKVFHEIMSAPDKAIPKDILDDAECVAVFPEVIQAAFGIGGRGGRGVASCRTPQGWSAPAYFNLGGGSIGWQIGVDVTDYVMLFMTDEGLNSLLSSKVTIGAGASVAAGPVGRQAEVATDAKLNAQILSYSRSKGLFAGLALKGTVIELNEDDMRDAYGPGTTAKAVLKDATAKAPTGVLAFPQMLATQSVRK